MNILFLLLLIPLYVIAFVFNVGTLVNIIVNNDINFVYYALSIIVIYILSFLLLHLLGKCFNDVPKIRNIEGDEFSITNTIVITINFFFALCIFSQSFIYKLDIPNLIIASSIVIIYIYYMIEYKKQRNLITYKLIHIDNKNKAYDSLLFEGKQNNLLEFNVNKKHEYKEDHTYLCKASSRRIYKIIKEVIDID